jgi:(2Fe-2S) ferredoxin
MDHRPGTNATAEVTAVAEDEKKYVFVCMNADCRVRGANEVMERLQERMKGEEFADYELRPYMCFGGCHEGPNVVMYPDKVWYSHVKKEDADRIVDEHLKKGEPITPLTGKVDKGLEEIIFQLLDSGIF